MRVLKILINSHILFYLEVNILRNELVGLYLYATTKRQGEVSDDDELYYHVLEKLEEHGWYDSSSGTLVCKDESELAYIVDDYMIGFEEDFPGLSEKIKEIVQSQSEMHAPEIMFVSIFEVLRRMVAG